MEVITDRMKLFIQALEEERAVERKRILSAIESVIAHHAGERAEGYVAGLIEAANIIQRM